MTIKTLHDKVVKYLKASVLLLPTGTQGLDQVDLHTLEMPINDSAFDVSVETSLAW